MTTTNGNGPTARDISMMLSDRAPDVAAALLPGGGRVGLEWKCGDATGAPGDSLGVTVEGPKAGLWHDFSTGQGGDLLDLAAAVHGSKAAGFRWARGFLGLPDRGAKAPSTFHPLQKAFRRGEGEPWMRGVASWAYHDELGGVFAHVVRFALPGGKKDILPLRFMPPDGQLPDPLNPSHWRWKGWRSPEPVPLYNAHVLRRRPADHVLVVEGEKTADAAAALFPSLVVVTWQGGSKTAERAAIEPLRGRDVAIWPDNDDPGRRAATVLAARIPGARIVRLPGGLPEGWDLADPVPDGVDVHAVLAGLPDPAPARGADAPGATAEPATATAEPATALELIADAVGRCWWTRRSDDPSRGYAQVDKDSARKLLVMAGFSGVRDETGACDADRELIRRQTSSSVVYSGPMAGRRPGVLAWPSGDVVVTSGFTLPSAPPSPAEPPRAILAWISSLLGNDTVQVERLLLWLHFRRRALRLGAWRHGHGLVLVGPANCGKSLLQSRIITALLGGRIAKPYRYMSGATEFNGDLMGAEHLAIEDDSTARDLDSRRRLAATLKGMLFSQWQSAHPKNRQAISLSPIWALSWSLNDEPENLQTLPPMEPSILDKLLVLRCSRAVVPREPGDDGDDWDILDSILAREIPALGSHVDSLEVPPALAEPRCGFLAWQHPSILEELGALSPEAAMLDLIDQALFRTQDSSFPSLAWRGSTADLERALRDHDNRAADRVLRFNSACGLYMNRLADQTPRVAKSKSKGYTYWSIQPPGR